ncbi:MAG: SWIM zinc finger family protein [Methylomicrobium sp.]|nr:SWIM zinc finger family protein [Methylomicrobium sp.]
MQSIALALLRQAPEVIWHRGEAYAEGGKVRIVKSDDKKIEAVVKGTKEYTVKFKFKKSGLEYGCSCPYSDGICKHVVAAAIVHDEMHGMKRPTPDVIKVCVAAAPPITRREVRAFYAHPLKVDLEKVRIMGDYLVPSKKRHAVLPKRPKIDSDTNKPLEMTEIQDAFKKMESWARRPAYHHYFCGGEMAAAFSELLEVFESRLDASSPNTVILVMAQCVDWYYRGFNQVVDGSNGKWIFPQARIGRIVAQLRKKHPGCQAWQEFNRIVKEVGDWWGEPDLDTAAIAEWMHGKL